MELGNELSIQLESAVCLNTLLKIQKGLDYCDMVSVIFLLCESPARTFEDLTAYQHATEATEANILFQWGTMAQARRIWKWELLETLFTSQLFSTIKNLGLNLFKVKQFFATTKTDYVHPMKKVLYKICETMTKRTLSKLQRILRMHHNIVLADYDSCEILFLKLMTVEFFTIPQRDGSECGHRKVSVLNIVSVLDQFRELRPLCLELKSLAGVYNCHQMKPFSFCDETHSGTLGTCDVSMRSTVSEKKTKQSSLTTEDLAVTLDSMSKLKLEDSLHLKIDTSGHLY